MLVTYNFLFSTSWSGRNENYRTPNKALYIMNIWLKLKMLNTNE